MLSVRLIIELGSQSLTRSGSVTAVNDDPGHLTPVALALVAGAFLIPVGIVIGVTLLWELIL
ncbi:hypothetical protein CIK76_05065 [Glutamicibacter sp. BW80]|nr:hypothetical protein CIK76_05065 [Glutamicibacter sp. BW80]